jgi:hypothetical protein
MLTPEDYLEIERKAEFKSEYHNGEMFAMAGGASAHNLIAVDVVPPPQPSESRPMFCLQQRYAHSCQPDGGTYSRLIRLATYPAPNPLSMLTTVTLLAQLLSIPSSAARPWKLAP